MQDKELRKIQGVLLLPSMWGMAMHEDREFRFCYWHQSNEESDSNMAI
jgi:hypothetical protein